MRTTTLQVGNGETSEGARRARLISAALKIRSEVDVLEWRFLHYAVPVQVLAHRHCPVTRAEAPKGPKRDRRWLWAALVCLATSVAAMCLRTAMMGE